MPEIDRIITQIEKRVTYSPVLSILYSNKPNFLKTDLNAEFMGWILIQPAYEEEPQQDLKILHETGELLYIYLKCRNTKALSIWILIIYKHLYLISFVCNGNSTR